MLNKKELKQYRLKYYKWLKSLGIKVNTKTGRVITKSRPVGNADLSYLKVKNSIPLSDRIPGACVKRELLKPRLPAGKAISIAYNKGNYQLVDVTDFKTMGRKI